MRKQKGVVSRKLPAKLAVGMLAASLAPGLSSAAEKTIVELETIQVEGKKPTRGSLKTESTQIGKMRQKLKDIPQTITVVNKQLLEDKAVDNLREALRNVAGITFSAGEGGGSGDIITIRGFGAKGDTYRDGVRDIGQYNRDIFNDEKVEVLKGASSMLFGRGSTGGVINQVSKMPYIGELKEIGLNVGTDDYYRATLDVNHAFTDTVAARVNLMTHDQGSDRPPVDAKRFGFAPSIGFGLGTTTSLTLSWYHLKENNLPDFGVPFDPKTKEPLGVPRERFYGLSSDYEHTETDIARAHFSHQLNDKQTFNYALQYNRYWRDLHPTAPRFARGTTMVTDTTPVTRNSKWRKAQEWSWTNQVDLLSEFDTGFVKHSLLTGIEWKHERFDTRRYTTTTAFPSATVGKANPNDKVDLSNYESASHKFSADNLGIYVMDTLELSPQWKAVLGVRFDHFDGRYENQNWKPANVFSSGYETNRLDKVWSSRAGLIWQPTNQQTYFMSYSTSFNPSGEDYVIDKAEEKVGPEKNRNMELGAQWDFFEGDASLRASVFRIEKTNERNKDLFDATTVLLSGKRHTNGVEIEAAGRLTSRWELFANAIYMDSKIDKAVGKDKDNEGKMPRNIPRFMANMWTHYKFTEEWIAGFGINYMGKQFVFEDNSASVPGYTTANTMLAYEKRDYKVQLNINNLFNKTYFIGPYPRHAVYGAPREIKLGVTMKF